MRVLGFGSRLCSDEWRIWGNVVALSPSGDFVAHESFDNKIESWAARHGRNPTLDDLLVQNELHASELSTAPLMTFSRLAFVRVVSKTFSTDVKTITYLCAVYGAGKDSLPDSVTISFRPGRGANCGPLAPGDSLIVPVQDPAPRHLRVTYPTCPNYLQVVTGFLPGVGVSLDELDRVLVERPDGTRTISTVSTPD
jgi:hypothetical protein